MDTNVSIHKSGKNYWQQKYQPVCALLSAIFLSFIARSHIVILEWKISKCLCMYAIFHELRSQCIARALKVFKCSNSNYSEYTQRLWYFLCFYWQDKVAKSPLCMTYLELKRIHKYLLQQILSSKSLWHTSRINFVILFKIFFCKIQ